MVRSRHAASPFFMLALLPALMLASACVGGGDDSAATDAADTVALDDGTDSGTSAPGDTTALADDSTSGSSSGGIADDTTGTDEDSASSGTTAAGPPQVVMETTLGTIVIELYAEASPITVANFITYVEGGFYDGTDGNGATVLHRVIPGFVIQGGGLTETLMSKTTLRAIVNESSNGVRNLRGTLSMARLPDPDTATSQFFVNVVDNPGLDDAPGTPGYAVFAEVVEGMDVVDAIVAVPTTSSPPFEDVPVDPIIMTSVTVQ